MIPDISRKKIRLIFCLIVVVNLCVKILGITYNQIALDEPFSIYHAQFSIAHIYHTLVAGNNPPLYEMFLHYWIKIFGIDAVSVRLPSVIFSSLASGFWFLTALYGMNFWYALGSAFFFTFSTQYIYFSHEARAYALVLMLLAMSTYLLARIWNGEKSTIITFFAAIVSALCIYTHYLAIIPVGLLSIYTAIKALKNKKLFIYLLALVVFIAPISLLISSRVKAINEIGLWGNRPVWTQLYGYLNIFLNGRITLAVVTICLLITVFLFIIKREKIFIKNELLHIFIWGTIFSIGYISMFIISYRQPIFIERYVQVIMPFFFLSLCGLFSLLLSKIKLGRAFGLVVLLVFCVQANMYPSNERNPEMVVNRSKEYLSKSDDRYIYIYPHWYGINFTYYFDRTIFSKPNQGESLARLNIRNFDFVPDASAGSNDIVCGKFYSNILYIDAGEFFVNGNHNFLEALLQDYEIEKKDSIDKQTTLYYLTFKLN